MPASIQAQFQGTAKAFRASLVNTPFLILAAIVTVYILLGVLYESYIHPITILSTLPSAGVGESSPPWKLTTPFTSAPLRASSSTVVPPKQ